MAKTEKNQEKNGKLEQFFDVMGNKSTSTINGYKSAIWLFFKFVLKLTDAEKPQLSEKIDAYFASNPNVVSDFKNYLQGTQQKKAPLGALQTFNQIQNFFKMLDVTISPRDLKMLKNQLPACGNGSVISEETNIDTDLIRQMIAHTDVKGKALLLTLATSGARIGELLNIKCADVKFPSNDVPVTTLFIRKAKNHHTRHTHVSAEATEAIREWIKVRPQYLEATARQGMGLKNRTGVKDTDTDRLFPFSESTVGELIADLVTKVTGENARDANTNRSLIHAHGFRKFFDTNLKLAGVPAPVVDALTGHLTNLEKTYQKMSPAQTAMHYIKGEHALYIEAIPEIREAATNNQKKFDEHRERIDVNQALINSLTLKNERLNEKIAQQSEQMKLILEHIATLEKVLEIHTNPNTPTKPLAGYKSDE